MSDASRDHLTPKAYGGTNRAQNLALAHKWCNKDKGKKIFRVEQHDTGYVVVDPKGDIVSDVYDTYTEAIQVTQELNEDKIYLDTHYEEAKMMTEDSDIIILSRVQDHPV